VIEQTVCSGLSVRDQALASGGNARRLLHLREPEDAQHMNAPALFGVQIVDVHAHVGSWERTCSPVKTPDAISDSMRRCGISKYVASSFAAIHGEMRAGNQQTADLVRQLPGRLYGYCAINPHYPEETAGELRQRFDCDTGFVGLKLHCGLHNVQLQHTGYMYALAFANERALPSLVHGGGADRWAQVCERYPRVPFIMAHGCAWDGFDAAFRETLDIVRDTPNLFVDVAGSPAHRGALRKLVEWVGVDKVLFGSDFPMFDLGFEAGRVTRSDLDLAHKTAICAGNARRVFERLQ
jgi:hypothetical protein